MIGTGLLYHVHRCLKEIMSLPGDTHFGQISMLAVDDYYLLQPVAQSFVISLSSDNYANLHDSLWQEHFPMIELSQTMRQQQYDHQFAE